MTKKVFSLSNIDIFKFDFDGVLTNNLVHTNQDGQEFVSCSRTDGLAFDAFRKLKKPSLILSTEKSLVVSARAKKLKIPCIHSVSDKAEVIHCCDEAFPVPSKDTGRIQEAHITAGHALMDYIEVHLLEEC